MASSDVRALRGQIGSLKRQKAFAWAKFYESEESSHEQVGNVYRRMTNVEEDLPTHLLIEFQEMTSLLKKMIECPICLEVIEDGQLEITHCGHKYCQACRSQITQCAICRKSLKPK